MRVWSIWAIGFGCGHEAELQGPDAEPPAASPPEATPPDKDETRSSTPRTPVYLDVDYTFGLCNRAPHKELLEFCDAPTVAIHHRVAERSGLAHDSVEAALDAATHGDIVWICPGSWAATANLDAKVVTMAAVDPALGTTTLTGGGVHRILLSTDSKVTIDGLTLERGTHPDEGAALAVTGGSLAVGCSRLANNQTGTGGSGAALHATGTAVTMSDCEIDGNTIEGSGATGGALTVIGGSLGLARVVVHDNQGASGGAVYVLGSDVELLDGTFHDNSGIYGGALFAAPGSHVVIVDSAFEANYAVELGGAVAAGSDGDPTSVSINGGWFDGNQSDLDGGALAFSGDVTAVLTDVEVANGTAANLGGGVAIVGEMTGALTITGGSFHNLYSANEGGALGMRTSGSPNVWIEAVEFASNEADYEGGAAYLMAEDGAADVTILGSTFASNHAGNSAGAVKVGALLDTGFANLRLEDSVFDSNATDYAAGALELGSAWGTVTGSISRCTFDSNVAGYEGGAASISGWGETTSTFANTTFLANEADYEGGAMSIGSQGTTATTIVDSTFRSNVAVRSTGGGIQVGSWGEALLELVDTDLVDNTADSGGAIGARGWGSVTLRLTGGVVSGNAALDGNGGGIVADMNETCVVTISGTQLVDNSAQGGAALNASGDKGGSVHLTDVVVHRNISTQGGTRAAVQTDLDLFCATCDFGEGVDDNSPYDLRFGSQPYVFGTNETFNLP